MDEDWSFSLPTEELHPMLSSVEGYTNPGQPVSTSLWSSTTDSASIFFTPTFNTEPEATAMSPSRIPLGVHSTATSVQAAPQRTVPSSEPSSNFVNPPAVQFSVTENGPSRSLQSSQKSQQINPAQAAGRSSAVTVYLDPSPSVPPQPLSNPRAVYVIHGNRTTSFEMAKAIWKYGDPKGWRMFCILGCYAYLGFDVVPEGTLCEYCRTTTWQIRTC